MSNVKSIDHRPNVDATLARLQKAHAETVAPPKFCKDCYWHSFTHEPKEEGYRYRHHCLYPPLLDMITGEPSSAPKNRNTETLCGRAAKHFAPKVGK